MRLVLSATIGLSSVHVVVRLDLCHEVEMGYGLRAQHHAHVSERAHEWAPCSLPEGSVPAGSLRTRDCDTVTRDCVLDYPLSCEGSRVRCAHKGIEHVVVRTAQLRELHGR